MLSLTDNTFCAIRKWNLNFFIESITEKMYCLNSKFKQIENITLMYNKMFG